MLQEHEAQLCANGTMRQDIVSLAVWVGSTHELTRRVENFVGAKAFVDRDLAKELLESFAIDMFNGTVLEAVTSQHTEIHAVILYQIYMDIIDVTRDVVLSSAKAIWGTRDFSDCRISKFEENLPKLGCAFRKKFHRSAVRDRCKKRSVVLSGVLDLEHEDDEDDKDAEHDREITLLNSLCIVFPVYAGMMTDKFILDLYCDGISVCNEDAIVMSVATLYTACRKSRLLRRAWKDMDFFINSIGPKALGLGDNTVSKKSLQSAAKQYGLALGVSARAYSKENANGARVPLPTSNQIEGRRPRLQPSSSLFKFADKVSNGLDAGLSQEQAMEAGLYKTVTELLDRPYSDIDIDEKLVTRWRTCGKLTPIEILAVLEDQYQSEELSLLFDYHSFFLKCAGILATIRRIPMKVTARPGPSLHEKAPAGYGTTQMVDEILWEAVEVEKHGGELRATVLGFTSENFDYDIKQNGSTCLEMATYEQELLRCDAKSEMRNWSKPEKGVTRAQCIAQGASMAMVGARVDFTGADLTESEMTRARAGQSIEAREIERQDAGMDAAEARELNRDE